MPAATASESVVIKAKAQSKGKPEAKSDVKAKATPKPKPRPAGADDAGKYRDAAALLKMVADPTRLRVVTMLADGEMNVGDMAKRFGLTQPAVSHHLAMLRLGDIVIQVRRARNNFYHLSNKGRLLIDGLKGIVGA